LLISEAAATDRKTVCSGLMILDSEQNSNLSKIIYLPYLGLLTSSKPRISITLMKFENGAQTLII